MVYSHYRADQNHFDATRKEKNLFCTFKSQLYIGLLYSILQWWDRIRALATCRETVYHQWQLIAVVNLWVTFSAPTKSRPICLNLKYWPLRDTKVSLVYNVNCSPHNKSKDTRWSDELLCQKEEMLSYNLHAMACVNLLLSSKSINKFEKLLWQISSSYRTQIS